MEDVLRFTPSRVEGAEHVSEVAVRPDRLDYFADGRWISVRFDAIAAWPRPRALWRALARAGVRLARVPVADRDGFHAPKDRYFRFYTSPALIIYMPDETADGPTFCALRETLARGGFTSRDLG